MKEEQEQKHDNTMHKFGSHKVNIPIVRLFLSLYIKICIALDV